MKSKVNIDLENIIRLREIADIYALTKQTKKSEKYHESIIEICENYPKDEKILTYKLESLNFLKKAYKSLETSQELLTINPKNIDALLNIATRLKEEKVCLN